MSSVILVHPRFDGVLPFAGDELHRVWAAQGPVIFERIAAQDERPAGQVVARPGEVERLALLGVPITAECAPKFSSLRQYAAELVPNLDERAKELLARQGAARRTHASEAHFGQSVAEFALALTLCGLRRIPQSHRDMIAGQEVWSSTPPGGMGKPGMRGKQFTDDIRFTCGTVEGKRVRVVGVGNIGSRYASWMAMLGAEVAAWDPLAPEPCFHRSGARRVRRLEDLLTDAEIFAPILPLTDKTRGIITAGHIDTLPKGCLVVLVTRARICDTDAIRRRVLADEVALAADVFDVEPLPLNDPLLGRHNVVHTPHQAGRTRQYNETWARMLAAQFDPLTASTEANASS